MLWGPKQVSDWHAQMSQWPSTVENALFFNVSLCMPQLFLVIVKP